MQRWGGPDLSFPIQNPVQFLFFQAMLPTNILCSSYYPAWPPGPGLKTNLFAYTNVFSNILELSLKASSCFPRFPWLWFWKQEQWLSWCLPSRPNTIHFRGIQHWKGEGLNQILGPFSAPGCPDFIARYSRELQTLIPGLEWYKQAGVALVFVKVQNPQETPDLSWAVKTGIGSVLL